MAERVSSEAIAPPFQPNIASSSATVAPLLAAVVAADLHTPCARTSHPRCLAGCAEIVPKLSFVSGSHVRHNECQLPARPARIVSANAGRINSVAAIVKPLFSVLISAMPSRTC